jgi:hypothetical protein
LCDFEGDEAKVDASCHGPGASGVCSGDDLDAFGKVGEREGDEDEADGEDSGGGYGAPGKSLLLDRPSGALNGLGFLPAEFDYVGFGSGECVGVHRVLLCLDDKGPGQCGVGMGQGSRSDRRRRRTVVPILSNEKTTKCARSCARFAFDKIGGPCVLEAG